MEGSSIKGIKIFCLLAGTSFLWSLGNSVPLPTSPGGKPDQPPIGQSDRKPSPIIKRSPEEPYSLGSSNEEEAEDEQPIRDPYPMLISKKSATVLNKLVTALRNSYDQNAIKTSDFLREKELLPLRNSANYEMFNLQRRNQKDRKNYLRCYFNAVSCF